MSVEMRLDGNILTIKAVIGSGVPSASGKTIVVATTNGFTAVPNSDLKVSLNVIKSRKGG